MLKQVLLWVKLVSVSQTHLYRPMSLLEKLVVKPALDGNTQEQTLVLRLLRQKQGHSLQELVSNLAAE